MKADRQPDYDFFVSPPSEAPARGFAVPTHPGWAQQGWVQQQAMRPRSGPPRWLLGVIAGLAMMALLFVSFFGVPALLNQRATSAWKATKVALPKSIAGRDRVTGRQVDAIVKVVAKPPVTAKNVGLYGAIGADVILVIAVKSDVPMTTAQQGQERAGFVKGGAGSGMALNLKQQKDAGKLGGWFGCSSAPAGVTVCLATDQGSLFGIVMGPAITSPAQLARQAREATITRN